MEEDICSNCTISITNSKKSQNDLPLDCTPESSFVAGTTEGGNGNPGTEIDYVDSALTSFFKLDHLNAFHVLGPEENKLSLCQSCSVAFNNLYEIYNNFVQLRQSGSLLASRIAMLEEIMDLHAEKNIYCEVGDTFQRQDNSGNLPNTLIVSEFIDSLRNRKHKPIKNTVTLGTQTSGGFFVLEPRVVLTRLTPQEFSLCKQQQQKEENILSDGEGEGVKVDFDDNQSDILDPPDDPLDYLDCVVIKEEEDDGPESEVDTEVPGMLEPKKASSKNNSNSFPKEKKKTNSKIRRPSPPSATKRSSRISARTSKSSLTSNSIQQPKESVSRISKTVKKSSKSKSSTTTKTTGTGIIKKKTPELIKDYKNLKVTTKTYMRRRVKVPNPCWYCPQDFPTPSACLEHTQQVHVPLGSSWPVCQRCSKICISQNSLDSHMTTCESIPSGVILPKQFQCTLCPRSYSNKDDLKAHMFAHSTDRPFPCKFCPYAAKKESGLETHILNMHQPAKEKIKCDECGTEVKNEERLRWHKYYMHTAEGALAKERRQAEESKRKREITKARGHKTASFCCECNVDFFSHLGLVLHQKSCHPETLGSLSICELCGESFSSRSYLQRHKQFAHSDKRPFLCPTCGASFKSLPNMKKHDRNTHSEEGRIKFNAYMRERNRRKKLLQSQTATISSSSSQNVETTQDASGEQLI